MKKLLVTLMTTLLPFTAAAHGPTPQKAERTLTVKAEPAQVWNILKDPANLSKWHPSANGIKIKSADDADLKVKYEIVDGTIAVADCNAFLKVQAGPGAGESTVTWVARFYRVYKLNPPIPAGQDDESALKAINGVMDSGLPALQKLVENK